MYRIAAILPKISVSVSDTYTSENAEAFAGVNISAYLEAGKTYYPVISAVRSENTLRGIFAFGGEERESDRDFAGGMYDFVRGVSFGNRAEKGRSPSSFEDS
ncbi:MAG: hypothetical protein IJP54_04075 [Synergistaceae bacterium]|nr:hypothetical protein [Synergistaceae bacterium]